MLNVYNYLSVVPPLSNSLGVMCEGRREEVSVAVGSRFTSASKYNQEIDHAKTRSVS